MTTIDQAQIRLTAQRIDPHIRRTPTIAVKPGDFGLDSTGPLTLELLQHAAPSRHAAAFAALLSGRYSPRPEERVGVLLCGGNTSAVEFGR